MGYGLSLVVFVFAVLCLEVVEGGCLVVLPLVLGIGVGVVVGLAGEDVCVVGWGLCL